MGFFSSDNYSAEQIKQTIRPTLDIAYSAIEAYEKIDKPPRSGIIGMALLESEYAVLNELQNILSIIFLYYGVSATQANEIGDLLDKKKISSPTMGAVNKSFIFTLQELQQYETKICIELRLYGLSHTDAIKLLKRAWQEASSKKPTEMASIPSAVKEARWDWINANSWASIFPT